MGFSACHPAVSFLYFACVIAAALALRHPVYLAVAFIGSFAYAVKLRRARGAALGLILLPCAAAFALWYASIHHFGVTVLRQNFVDNNITLEALVSGAKTADEAKAMLDTSLRRTGAGYFDFYLLHNLGDNRIKAFDDFGIWDFVQEKKAQGVLKHVGFSFHDKAEVLDEILNKHPEAEFVQLQINYADWESDSVQSRRCY